MGGGEAVKYTPHPERPKTPLPFLYSPAFHTYAPGCGSPICASTR